MARYPKAIWKPIARNFTKGGNRCDTVVFHTAADGPSTTSLQGWFNRASTKASAHFFVRGDGTIEQYIDTADCAWSAYSANSRAIAIETHDGGRPTSPWTAPQLAALIELAEWLCTTHRIRRAACTSPSSGGIGYHEQFGEWNRNGHHCPGPAREDQVRRYIIPALAGAPARAAQPLPARPAVHVGDTGPLVLILQYNLSVITGRGAECELDGRGTFGLHTVKVLRDLDAFVAGSWGDATIVTPSIWQQLDFLVAMKGQSVKPNP